MRTFFAIPAAARITSAAQAAIAPYLSRGRIFLFGGLFSRASAASNTFTQIREQNRDTLEYYLDDLNAQIDNYVYSEEFAE